MSIFSRKPKPARYVPGAGAVTLDRTQFSVMMRTRPIYRDYSRLVGLAAARTALDNAFTENLRCMSANGYWTFGTTASFGNPTFLRFPDDAGLASFIDTMDLLFKLDIDKMTQRSAYIDGLKGKYGTGVLLNDLRGATEPEGAYYHAPAPAPPKVGAPAVPPKPAHMVNQAKGLAWLTSGVIGDTSAFTKLLLQNAKFDGSFPLGADASMLLQAWRTLVPLAPQYRGWSMVAYQQKYPSNVGGMKVLNDVLVDLSTSAMPPIGDDRWYGLALHTFGSIMTVQAFTDGNKRMSRFAYVLVLLSGGVAMVVPNGVLGGRLGDMM